MVRNPTWVTHAGTSVTTQRPVLTHLPLAMVPCLHQPVKEGVELPNSHITHRITLAHSSKPVDHQRLLGSKPNVNVLAIHDQMVVGTTRQQPRTPVNDLMETIRSHPHNVSAQETLASHYPATLELEAHQSIHHPLLPPLDTRKLHYSKC